jgi:Ca2+-binding EF-hand superfamily protein
MSFMSSVPSGVGRINFDAFSNIAGHFLEEEDAEAMQEELKEAFRLYDREGQLVLKRGSPLYKSLLST